MRGIAIGLTLIFGGVIVLNMANGCRDLAVRMKGLTDERNVRNQKRAALLGKVLRAAGLLLALAGLVVAVVTQVI